MRKGLAAFFAALLLLTAMLAFVTIETTSVYNAKAINRAVSVQLADYPSTGRCGSLCMSEPHNHP